jgi:hypothetical protein
MIKPGKACSQLMEAKKTGETKIKVVEKYFSTYNCFFNALKNSSKFIFELIASSEFIFIFRN